MKMKATDAVKPARREKPNALKAADVMNLIKKESPKLLGKVPEKKAMALIKAAFLQLGRHINAVKQGVVRVPGFGNFRVRQVEREKDGQKVKVTRTIFRAAKKQAKAKQRVTE